METCKIHCLSMIDKSNYSLLGHNTFGIEARCRRFLGYESQADAEQVAATLRESGLPFLIIGGGSNLLLTGDFPGIVVRSYVQGVHSEGTRMTCGSGMEWDRVVEESLRLGLYGAENLSLIPGDVGACAVQNIGAYGAEAKDLIASVWAVEIATGRLCHFRNADCGYGYRDSRFKHEWRNKYLILRVELCLSRQFEPRLDYGNVRAELERRGMAEPTAAQLREVIVSIRRAKLPDPAELGNAGSFFVNPVVSRQKYEELAAQYADMPHYHVDEAYEKIPAGWLIEQCGWKGRSLGRAGVYEHQALVIVNRGGATGGEIVALYEAVRADVLQKFGIALTPEVCIV